MGTLHLIIMDSVVVVQAAVQVAVAQAQPAQQQQTKKL
jgi:hypothetical protein